jgi:NADH:ubiquinone oxidoreductase subunit 2 (subunit N)
MGPDHQSEAPSLMRWALGVAASAGLAGMICCVAPMVLFMLGIMGGVYAISFADFFYAADGSAGTGAWILRGVAVVVGAVGFWMYRKKQDQCSIDQDRQKKNLMLLGVLIAVLGVGFFLSLEKLSGWYFDAYIVPAQQAELGITPPPA